MLSVFLLRGNAFRDAFLFAWRDETLRDTTMRVEEE